MRILNALLVLLFITSCGSDKSTKSTQQTFATSEKSFVVQEVIQTTNYSYLKVSENNSERWVAVTKLEAMAGDRYFYDKSHQMKDFHSKELNRDFETVDFINRISKTPLSQVAPAPSMKAPTMQAPHGHAGKAKSSRNLDIAVAKSTGELTIAQIFANPQQYANMEVEIKGKVVKINKNIMGKNWIHVQDGTNHNNKFDLTITSKQVPKLNQVVSFKGNLSLNKDFGAGYYYDVIVENGVIK